MTAEEQFVAGSWMTARPASVPRHEPCAGYFHYGLLSWAVLIVLTNADRIRSDPTSIANMAEYDLACRCYKILPIPVPILIIGLLPEN